MLNTLPSKPMTVRQINEAVQANMWRGAPALYYCTAATGCCRIVGARTRHGIFELCELTYSGRVWFVVPVSVPYTIEAR